MWTNLFQRAHLPAGEHVLIHGGSSGIGTTAIQLARAFDARPIATAGTPAKCQACERLGAVAINYREHDFVETVRELTGRRGADVILDIVGGDYLTRNLECLAMNGRIAQIGLQGGAKTQVNLAMLMLRRATLTGSTLRPRTVEEKGAIARDLEARVWPLLAAGQSARRCTPCFHSPAPPMRTARSRAARSSARSCSRPDRQRRRQTTTARSPVRASSGGDTPAMQPRARR